jgi:hypothetical protein
MADSPDPAIALGDVAPHLPRVRIRAFYAALTLAVLLFAAPAAPFLIVPVAWPFLGDELGVHQVHDIARATLMWFLVAGLLAQFRRAEHQIGAMQQVVLVVLVTLSTTAISRPASLLSPLLVVFGVALIVAALHPSRAEVVRMARRVDPLLTALALVAAGPLVMYGRGQLRFDADGVPIAAHGGHWTMMSVVAFSIVALALLVATRPRGWRVPAYSAAGAAVLFGVSSAVLPHRPSSVGPVWGALTAAWGIAFVLLAEIRYRAPRVRS